MMGPLGDLKIFKLHLDGQHRFVCISKVLRCFFYQLWKQMDVYLINYQYCLIVYYFLKCYQHPNYFYNCCPMHRMHHIYAWARYDKLNSCINGSIFFQGKCAHLHKHLNVVSLNIADMCISSIYPTRYIELMHILRVDGLE